MAQDTLLGFPAHTLPFPLQRIYLFIDSLSAAVLANSGTFKRIYSFFVSIRRYRLCGRPSCPS